jgi:cobyrinic acid a,c-diamide synthase
VNRIVIAAPSSGSGKTTVAMGLLGALREAGHRVAPFKVGPDFIDPGFHAIAAGRPGRNLDPVLVGEERIVPLFRHGSAGCDIAVVEGVMGLFDGRVSDHRVGSTAHVAGLLSAPVVLVVDVRGQSHSLAAVLHGFRSYDSGINLAGVILNQVGSDRHLEVLRAACDEVGLEVLGAIPRYAPAEVPSRHLGLTTAVELGGYAEKAVTIATELVRKHVDVERIFALSTTAGPLSGPSWNPVDEVAYVGSPVIAVARGAAFTFGYTEHAELLRAAGSRVVEFDPLRDERLPLGTGGVFFGGGFPELYVQDLSENQLLRAEIAKFPGVVHAECGGLLYLLRSLDDAPMCGVLPATARMSGKLTLGYRDAVATSPSALFKVGQRVSGHEFHRTLVDSIEYPDSVAPAWAWRGASEGFASDRVHASYLHTHPAGNPGSVESFVGAACRIS